MLKRLPGIAALLMTLLALTLPALGQGNQKARVSALYTTWDDFYFYAGFQVRDPNVLGTNTTPISQPQQDDDIEVFLETDSAKANVRTPKTYQMAVSAAGGAYFSVGNNSRIPKARAIYTYKYAVGVDGTLNNGSDRDTGYTIELAIPWQELGQSGPPAEGAVWGFNAISRDRTVEGAPASRFYSLSPNVASSADVQNPSKWMQIVFTGGGEKSTASRIVCPHVTGHFPFINGSIVSGEWPGVSRVSFGTAAIDAPAPTVAEEPNTTDTPFTTPPALPETPPAPAPPRPKKPGKSVASTYPNAIPLPGGGSIKVVPGGIKNPEGLEPDTPPTNADTGAFTNPLTPKYGKNYTPPKPSVSLAGSLTLGPAAPPRLIMAIYRLDYNADARKAASQNVWDAKGGSALVDQPINGCGPWFSGLRPLWHRQQLTDMRRAGINVALLQARSDDPLLGRELDALVEALKEMKARGLDYPLVGFSVTGPAPNIDMLFSHIPVEFRATLAAQTNGQEGALVYVNAPADADMQLPTRLSDDMTLTNLSGAIATVSPGRLEDGKVIPRLGGNKYAASWQKAMDDKAQFVVIDSWNDFTHGTEVCASRQYGEQYADATRVQTIAFNGSKEWHAKYLSECVPRTIKPRTLYQIPIRIENAGTLPWRSGEDYALVPRWYKDGRLFDDSAPRVPLGEDVLPGQSVTLNVGLVAQNGYGDNLDPGEYTLVFDMVQGEDRWFSYANDIPLQVPVTVASNAKTADYRAGEDAHATFLGTQTPVSGESGRAYPTAIEVRNDSDIPWKSGVYGLAYKIQKVSETGEVATLVESEAMPLDAAPVAPGHAADTIASVRLNDSSGQSLPVGEYRLHWYVKGPTGHPVAGSYDEPIRVVAADPGASFVLSEIPRAMDAGKTTTAKLAVQNLGPVTWDKKQTRIGYHWYSLDGVEIQWDGGPTTPLTKDVAPGRADGDIVAKVKAPSQPGRYALVWDMKTADGTWASTMPTSKGDDLLQVFVTVQGKGSDVPVDLAKYATGFGVAGVDSPGADFDGAGHALPAAMLPPDGTAEAELNPLTLGKPAPPLYPSGYYANHGPNDHRLPFLYPPSKTGGKNIVVCQGQTIDLPGGNYTTMHLLMTATGGQSAAGEFGLRSQSGQTAAKTITVSDWGSAPTAPGATIAFRSPYRATRSGDEATPCILGDYTLPLDSREKIAALVLPNNTAIKILAITLEK